MKKVIIFHGSGGNPEQFWFPYIKGNLPKEEYVTNVPQLPNTEKPILSEQLPFALRSFTYDEDTILIGHSSGCPLILSILENLETPVYKTILVAGFSEELNPGEHLSILQESYNWTKIKKNSRNFICINSMNDPWGCTDEVGKKIFDHVGGDFIIRSDAGHMGSDFYNQPYQEFPLLLSLITL